MTSRDVTTVVIVVSRYRCDSQMDCPQGDDESPVLCGPEPCKGKIVCPELDFRCIDPTEYCCDPQTGEESEMEIFILITGKCFLFRARYLQVHVPVLRECHRVQHQVCCIIYSE